MAKLHFLMSILITIGLETVECRSNLRREVFENGNYIVEWSADTEEQKILFNVTVAITGFVGFGINTLQGMKGADIIICSMYSDGRSYFADHNGIGNQAPGLDTSQDLNFITATETEGWTNVNFCRHFEYCEENDITITADTLSIIWSYGKTDEIGYHDNQRGAASSNMLDPPPPPADISGAEIWNISPTMVMPRHDTTYWCIIHRQATFPSEQFVIAVTIFPENVAYNMGDGSRPTYWMYEVHYEKPNEVEGLEIKAAIQVYHTSEPRPLRVVATVLPGDQLTYECTTGTRIRVGVTLTGFTTVNEMCETNIWYYPKIEFSMCGSFYYNFPNLFERFGIEAVDWDSRPTFYTYYPLVTAPAEHAGKLFIGVASSYPWTPESGVVLESELRYSQHKILCNRTQGTIVTYSQVDVRYHHPTTCNVTDLTI